MLRAVFTALFLLSSSAAFALSCAQPEMTRQAIEKTDVIFIGTVTKITESATDEMMAPTLYEFTVTKAYKGVAENDSVTVGRAAYWGDRFADKTSYVILANKNMNGVLIADLCGLSSMEEGAEELIGFLDSSIPKGQ
jgi:hypothetical protein